MKVIIYTTPTCVYCRATKEYFKQNNIKYTEKDVVSDLKARDVMVNKSGQRGVPVIVITDSEEHVIIGWNKSALDEVLGIGSHAVTQIKPKKKSKRK
ncbi:TPA: glutathione S-transferase N-terminal domain-containing protein [archaeon]|uniref:Glutathione S-transferase N-terminal domain-containing protein n=1 Tax=Candidatus Naiadarchaeum limnaeum TaxID=2756139 RepID=A0A832V116_9ARCH|nr:glutathione S-transferase N-terminal domain-containing protein [Candidatus Naiadarchaeales archaeon SRR2090153.bin1042]HIK00253.1 glutathione S-transferase N-terminal domain-containing protein [Candidatus Naiadarchaeum limnaeum]